MRKFSAIWKQPYFVIGFVLITILIGGSFVYEWIYGNVPSQTFYIEENGKPVEGQPISPRLEHPIHIFGTDQHGYDLLTKIILGAKYTILGALGVAALRMLLAVPVGLIIGTYWRKYRHGINSLMDPIHYFPMTIFAVFILSPILLMPVEGFTSTLMERIMIEVIILALLTSPIVISLVANETSLIYTQEYILASKALGAGNGRLIIKHILPQLREKLVIIFGQQVVETLILFTHLGIMKLFLGGTKVSYDPEMPDPPMSISYEWAGLLGDTFRYLVGAPWLPLTPAAFFAVLIFAISSMMEGYIRATNPELIPRKRKRITRIQDEVIEWNREQLREKMELLKQVQK
ncbi:ABC transporter permease [Chungangia koreensis]|uniref:ABC transporter permease n=1 Tax=Chungangia koreensis TaxID=752657 RepID=A0ABV8X5P1_9LACT